MPILLYGLESIELNKSMIQSIENAYSQVFSKIFHSFDRNVIRQCKFYMGQLTAELKINYRKLNFLSKINVDKNRYLRVFDLNRTELQSLALQHGINIKINNRSSDNWLSTINWKFYLFKYFETSLYIPI